MNRLSRLPADERRQWWRSLAATAGYQPGRLASLCQVSVRQLERYFDRDFGASPKDWLQRQRMKAANTLLKSAGSIKEVAYQLGFKHTSQFCRAYKKHSGITATEYLSRGSNFPTPLTDPPNLTEPHYPMSEVPSD